MAAAAPPRLAHARLATAAEVARLSGVPESLERAAARASTRGEGSARRPLAATGPTRDAAACWLPLTTKFLEAAAAGSLTASITGSTSSWAPACEITEAFTTRPLPLATAVPNAAALSLTTAIAEGSTARPLALPTIGLSALPELIGSSAVKRLPALLGPTPEGFAGLGTARSALAEALLGRPVSVLHTLAVPRIVRPPALSSVE